MISLYILWGADAQQLAQVHKSLFEGEKNVHIEGSAMEIDPKALSEDVEAVVWTALGDVRESLEKLPQILQEYNLELVRIIGVLDVAAYAGDRKLADWVKMLSHFSDVILMLNTKECEAAFISELERRWKDRPMLIKRWPQNSSDAGEILLPEARRLSQHFDEWEDGDDLQFFEGEDDDDWGYEDEQPRKKKTHSSREIDLSEINEPKAEEAYFQRDSEGAYLMKVKIP